MSTTATSTFDGKVAIVTGAASGIGKAVAAALSGRGAAVVHVDINAASLQEMSGESVVVDVTDATAVRRCVDGVFEKHGRLDFLFNNAGIGAGGPAELLGLEVWQRVIAVDLFSVIHGVAAAYPIMVRQGFGHIVNTASLAGLVPTPILTPYATAKAGVVGLSISLRVEAAAHGVQVSAVCPGPVDTPLLDQAAPGAQVNARKLLTNSLGEAYDVGLMAADILQGVIENRALIVAPETARSMWSAYRATPEAALTAMGERAVAARERREGSQH